MKTCTKCKAEKALDLFYRNKNGKQGRESSCKACYNDAKKRVKTSPELRAERLKARLDGDELFLTGLKRCNNCHQIKPVNNYYDNRRMRHGKSSKCKACMGVKGTAQRGGAGLAPGVRMCYACKEVKNLDHFYKSRREKGGVRSECKPCAKRMSKSWASKNKEKINARRRLRGRNLEAKRKHDREWYRKMTAVPEYRAARAMRNMVRRHARISGDELAGGSSDVLGYSPEDLRKRLEFAFKPGMSWDNYGEWHIDHKIPVSIFIRRGELRPNIVNALSNLQPLWASENASKGNRRVG